MQKQRSKYLIVSSWILRVRSDRKLQVRVSRDLVDLLDGGAVVTTGARGTAGTTSTREAARATGHAAGHATRSESGTGIGGRGGTAAEEELEAILVVDLALLRVGQDFVSLGALLEFLGSAGVVLVLVGVPLQSRFPVSFLDFLLSGIRLDSERIVELGFLDHDGQARADASLLCRGCKVR
jgi:hypothetical protein